MKTTSTFSVSADMKTIKDLERMARRRKVKVSAFIRELIEKAAQAEAKALAK